MRYNLKSEEQQVLDKQELELYKRIDRYTYFEKLQLCTKVEGISTYDEVNKADRLFSSERAFELKQTPIEGNFDKAHLLAIHEYLFQDIYYFAGQLRDVPMEIDPSTKFVGPIRLPEQLDKFFDRLKEFKGGEQMSKDAFVSKVADRLTDINILHPFREGNGRSKRLFFSQVAEKVGYKLDWSACDSKEWKMADECAFDSDRDKCRDTSYLKYLLERAVSPISEATASKTVSNGLAEIANAYTAKKSNGAQRYNGSLQEQERFLEKG